MAAISSASGAVGRPAIVLWDLLNTSIPNDVNIVKLGFEIIELAKSFEAYK